MSRAEALPVKRADARSLRRALPADLAAAVERIAATGDRLGLGVLLVGGPVRDLLLGLPIVDVDLIVEAGAPEAAAQGTAPALRLAEAAATGDAALVTHPRFGTARLTTTAGAVDLAGARAETYAGPGALPEVRPGSLAEDLARRDFAVNAMAIPLNATARRGRGALVDPLGGRRDLGRRVLRVLHPLSFVDDPTRALRGARLAARLGFRIDAACRAALRAACAEGAFAEVSGERFRAELAKLFSEAGRGGDPVRALAVLAREGVLTALAPGLAFAPAARRALAWLGPRLASDPAADPLLAGLSAWLAPLPPRVRTRALERLALRGRPAERVLAFPARSRRAERALARRPGRGAADALLGPFSREEALALAAGASGSVRRAVLRHLAEDRTVRPPLDGHDLAALGFAGPALGRALAAERHAFLDGAFSDRAGALRWAERMRRRAEGRAHLRAKGRGR